MTNDTHATFASTSQLLQVLTFWDLVVYGLVYVAPVGPWSTWGFASALSGGVVALVYLLGAVALLFTAFSYAQMVTVVPEAGSAYSYARAAIGETAGFLTGWMILLDYLLVPALMYVFCGASLTALIPDVPRWIWIVMIAVFNVGVNWFGVKTSARFNLGTLLIQFLMVAVTLVVAVVVMQRLGMPTFTPDAWWNADASVGGLFEGTSLCVMAYLGFDAITTLASEVRQEQRPLIGRAVIFVIILLGSLGVLNVWIVSDLGHGFVPADLTTITYELFATRVNAQLSTFMAWVGIFIVAASILPPMVTGVARVLYTMAASGEMPKYLAYVDPKYHVPRNAVLTSGSISASVALLLANNFDTLTTMVNFGALMAFLAVNASVIAWFVVRRKSRRYFAHAVLPSIGMAIIVAVLGSMNVTGLAVGLAWLALGFVVVRILRRRGAAVAVPIDRP